MDSLTHIGTTCGALYCSRDTGACIAKIAKLAIAFLEALANFIPGGKAIGAIKAAAKAGSKALLKKAIKAAAKQVAKRLLKDAKKNLKKYMKKQAKALREELMDSLLEGGAEAVAETTLAKTESGAIAEAALELVKAIDPTGISGIVDAFQADSCRSKMIDPMPEDGLNDEICPDAVTVSGVESWQSDRMTRYEYMGEDQDERPIYMSDNNQFLFYRNGQWLIGPDTNWNGGGLYRNGHQWCPTTSSGGNWNVWYNGWKSSSAVRFTAHY